MKCRTNSPARIGRMPTQRLEQPQEINSCMFCLCDTPPTIKYDGPCECKPYLHKRCLVTWFKKTPNECPLCRKDYDPLSEVEEELIAPPPPLVRRQVLIIFNRHIYFTLDEYTDNMKYVVCSIILLYVSTWLHMV